MADDKIQASTVFLFVKRTDNETPDADYRVHSCLLNFDMSLSVATNDASSMCGPDSAPGDSTITIPLNGQYIKNVSATKISAAETLEMALAKEFFDWKIAAAVPEDGDPIRTGRGFYSAYQESYGKDGPATYTATISVSGNPEISEAVGES